MRDVALQLIGETGGFASSWLHDSVRFFGRRPSVTIGMVNFTTTSQIRHTVPNLMGAHSGRSNRKVPCIGHTRTHTGFHRHAELGLKLTEIPAN